MANNNGVAGQGVRLRARNLKDLKDRPIASADVSSIVVSVWSEDWATQVLADTGMTYDATLDDWGYVWDSPGPEGAIYQVRVHVVCADGSDFTRDRPLLLRSDHA